MLKKSSVVIVSAAILAVSVSALAMNKSEKGIEGTVTSIKGNVVTIKDSKGGELLLEVRSTAGLKVGLPAWCEEDCGRTLKVGSTVVNVQKVIKKNQRAWGDPHVKEKIGK
ncbi:hypothetical protein OR1_00161 [Geobacter sp. OR-1]|uniref:hypothetical protein n=1 Tax=Geobacter sp. OR-1 TaxID=1266765 RepID=UPI000541AB96|nr:hypothetical protein [Geobacter sp. OR-1]GAM07892.1 hypothetical protein OR1_00161 [Geobacter sp. OR-1]